MIKFYLWCSLNLADIYDEVSQSVQGLGLDTECLGGGRIEHRSDKKWIKVYGYSQVSFFLINANLLVVFFKLYFANEKS